MRVLLSIGDFSRMTYLSVKALRHYHDIGLLEPAEIDASSGYRRYDSGQVATAQVIRRFRELGMPLEDVFLVLKAPDLETRNAAIIAHLQRMEEQLQRTQETVSTLRLLLEQTPAPIEVTFRTYQASHALTIDEHIARTSHAWWPQTFTELRAALPILGATRLGADGALFTNEFFEEGVGPVGAFIPVDREYPSLGRVHSTMLPAGEYAVTIHSGSLERLDQTYGALGTYVAERAIGVDGPLRENLIISRGETTDDDELRTEVCWPVFQTTSNP